MTDDIETLRAERDALAEELAAAEADLDEAVGLLRGLPCYLARGEGTYECRVDSLCPACAARSAWLKGAGS